MGNLIANGNGYGSSRAPRGRYSKGRKGRTSGRQTPSPCGPKCDPILDVCDTTQTPPVCHKGFTEPDPIGPGKGWR